MKTKTKSVNIHGNRTFEISEEVANALVEYSGYRNSLPSVDLSEYDSAKEWPYPLTMSLYEVVSLLDAFDLFTETEWTQAFENANDEIEEDDVEQVLSDKGLLEQIISPFRTSIVSYMFVCNQKWLSDAEARSIPFDWLFAYLITLSQTRSFAFTTKDEFGDTVSPIQINHARYAAGSMMSPPRIEVRFNTFHAYSAEKVIMLEHKLDLPLMPVIDFKDLTFLRGFDVSILTERNEKILALLSKCCESSKLIPGKDDRAYHLTQGFRGLVPQNTEGRYLFHPESTEEHYGMYPQICREEYVRKISEIEGFETWWLSRIVSAWHLQSRKGVLIAGDYLTETVYDKERINKLFLNPESQLDIEALCSATKEGKFYADPFRGKSSALVLLLGVPGTGKTSSIMGIADYFETPLIHISIADCGFREISYYLERIMRLAATFGAFVLVDEADALIFKRGIENMDRTEVVTKVLKVLEDFDGITFFTSNIDEEHIDPAIKSRLTTWIKFPHPSFEQIKTVWRNNLANIAYEISEETLDMLSQASLDEGTDLRSITKAVALLKARLDYNPEMSVNLLDYVR